MTAKDSPVTLALSLQAVGRSGREKARTFLGSGQLPPPELLERAKRVLAEAARFGFSWASFEDPNFPHTLKSSSDPPLGLFLRGRFPQGPAVAIVGSRRASAYGKEVARYLGRELAGAGVWVISGMARGVDTAAHEGALLAGGPTLAVWGCGCDRIYPPENGELAQQIASLGGIVTEYPPGTPPRKENFPERNRLIASLAQVLVVVEADQHSGALLSAKLALEEGREVMAVPGSVFSPLSVGPNGLLRAGAAPVLCAQDVLDALGIQRSAAQPAPSPSEEGLLGFLPDGMSLSVDELAVRSGMAVPLLLQQILALELEGKLIREPDGRWRRR